MADGDHGRLPRLALPLAPDDGHGRAAAVGVLPALDQRPPRDGDVVEGEPPEGVRLEGGFFRGEPERAWSALLTARRGLLFVTSQLQRSLSSTAPGSASSRLQSRHLEGSPSAVERRLLGRPEPRRARPG